MKLLRYTCHKENCGEKWVDHYEKKYGEVEADCPVCDSKHNTPEKDKFLLKNNQLGEYLVKLGEAIGDGFSREKLGPFDTECVGCLWWHPSNEVVKGYCSSECKEQHEEELR